MVLELCFSCDEGASSHMEVWNEEKKKKKFLLLVTLHDADSNPDIAKGSVGCLIRVWPRSAGVPRPVVLSTSRSNRCLSKRLQATLK